MAKLPAPPRPIVREFLPALFLIQKMRVCGQRQGWDLPGGGGGLAYTDRRRGRSGRGEFPPFFPPRLAGDSAPLGIATISGKEPRTLSTSPWIARLGLDPGSGGRSPDPPRPPRRGCPRGSPQQPAPPSARRGSPPLPSNWSRRKVQRPAESYICLLWERAGAKARSASLRFPGDQSLPTPSQIPGTGASRANSAGAIADCLLASSLPRLAERSQGIPWAPATSAV